MQWKHTLSSRVYFYNTSWHPHLTAPKFALHYPRIFHALSCLHLSHGLDTPKYPLTIPNSNIHWQFLIQPLPWLTRIGNTRMVIMCVVATSLTCLKIGPQLCSFSIDLVKGSLVNIHMRKSEKFPFDLYCSISTLPLLLDAKLLTVLTTYQSWSYI